MTARTPIDPVVYDADMYRTSDDPGEPAPPADVVDFASLVRLNYPWLPEALVPVFAAAWDEYGDRDLALAAMRADSRYDQFFPGNRRADGSFRMDEQTYNSTVDGYRRLLRDYGLNPEPFAGRFAQLIEGDVSAVEFANRLGAAYEEVVTNIPQVRAEWSRLYGVEGGTQALFATFIDPDIGQAILDRRIGVAQVAGEAVARGFTLERTFAESLVSGGVDQARARDFFSSAENLLPTLDTLARRHLDPDDTFDLSEFAQAGIFGDSEQSRRVRRLFNAEQSFFTGQAGTVAGSADALTGLTLR